MGKMGDGPAFNSMERAIFNVAELVVFRTEEHVMLFLNASPALVLATYNWSQARHMIRATEKRKCLICNQSEK